MASAVTCATTPNKCCMACRGKSTCNSNETCNDIQGSKLDPSMLDHFVDGSESRHSKQVRADLACAVEGAPVSWLLVAVSLQLALDDVSRIDCEPVHCPCCTPSYHEDPLPQLICIAQTLLAMQSHPSMQRHCHAHGALCFPNCLHAVPAVQFQQLCNFSSSTISVSSRCYATMYASSLAMQPL